MEVVRTRADLARALDGTRASGRVGLVPTMGFLHEGHLSLVDRARRGADTVVVSIFVNPLQFGPGEDLERYPRDEERDLALLRERRADVVYAPAVDEMYPGGGPVVTVDPGPLAERLCGAFRPGHFRGVLTVVAKLFGQVRPDVAVFGAKDFQQAVLIRRMVRDLDLGVGVELGPIVRERDGLALSSRNTYLSPDERADATGLVEGLRAAGRSFDGGEDRAAALLEAFGAAAARPSLEVEYAEVVDPATLEPADPVSRGSVLAVAAWCGRTRLIDNIVLGEAS